MARPTRPISVCAGLLCWLTAGGIGFAATPGVHDAGRLFTQGTMIQANELIGAIWQNYHLKVVIETYSAMPLLLRLSPYFKGPEGLNQAFSDWAKRRAHQAGRDGIYILICRQPEPVRVQVERGPQLNEFTAQEAEKLRHLLLINLATQPDRGLLDALTFVDLTLSDSRPAAPGQTFPWLAIFLAIGVTVVFWGCLESISRLLRRRSAAAPTDAEPVLMGAGGSLAAGLFSTMTGHWVGNLVQAVLHDPEPAICAGQTPAGPAEQRPATEGTSAIDLDATRVASVTDGQGTSPATSGSEEQR